VSDLQKLVIEKKRVNLQKLEKKVRYEVIT